MDIAAFVISVLAFVVSVLGIVYTRRQTKTGTASLEIDESRLHAEQEPRFALEFQADVIDDEPHAEPLRITNLGPVDLVGLEVETLTRPDAARFDGLQVDGRTVPLLTERRPIRRDEWVDVRIVLAYGGNYGTRGLLRLTARDSKGRSWSRIHTVDVPGLSIY